MVSERQQRQHRGDEQVNEDHRRSPPARFADVVLGARRNDDVAALLAQQELLDHHDDDAGDEDRKAQRRTQAVIDGVAQREVKHLGGQHVDVRGSAQQQRHGELSHAQEEHHPGGEHDGRAKQRQRDGKEAPHRRGAAGCRGRLKLLAHVLQAGVHEHIHEGAEQQAGNENNPLDRVDVKRTFFQT
jgi:hypothetical protein